MALPLPCPDGVLLRAVREGRTSVEFEAELAEHLKQCAQCRAVVEMILAEDAPIRDAMGPDHSGDGSGSPGAE